MYNMNYGDERNRNNYPAWSTHQQQSRAGDRLWVEISDDEDSMCQVQSVFKSGGGKTQPQATPPLDLSVIEQSNPKTGRQVESPLDLSVKTRKRCADTTDYEDLHLRQSHTSDGSLSKRLRLCQGQGDDASSHPGFTLQEKRMLQAQVELDQRHMMQDPLIQNKILQKQMMSRKYPTMSPRPSSQSQQPQPQTSPMSVSQQQYSNVQRQHQLSQQSRQMQQQGQYPPSNFDTHRSQTQTMQKQKSMFDPVAINTMPRPVQSNASETVALQGFFEPTHKVTVNAAAASAIPLSSYQHPSSRVSQEQTLMSSTGKNMYPASRPRDIAGQDEQRAHSTLTRGATYPMGANTRMSRPDINHLSPKAEDLGVMQQKQIEHQRQLQQQAQRAKKDQMPYMSQFSSQKAIIMTTPESQRMSQMMDLFKQTEQSHVQLMSKSQLSPYAPKTNYATSASHGSIRQEEAVHANARYIRAGQPIPLSDLTQRQSALEKAHIIQNQHNTVGQQLGMDSSRYSSRHVPMLDQTQRASIEQNRMMPKNSIERERRYVMNEPLERTVQFAQRNDHVITMNRDMHPSVIQRPQGFVPPRIVSGNGVGRPSSSAQPNAPINRCSDTSSIPRSRYNNLELGQISVDNTFPDGSQNKRNQDMSPLSATKSRSHQILEDIHLNRVAGGPRPHVIPEYRRDHASIPQQSLPRGRPKMDTSARNDLSMSKALHGESFQRGMSRSSSGNRSIPSEPQKPKVEPVKEKSSSSRLIMPEVNASERSITKGTSGMNKNNNQEIDLFSRFVMRELKRTDDDNTVNPFANRSLLQEFDRSTNSSPVRKPDLQSKSNEQIPERKETNSKDTALKEQTPSSLPNKTESASYTLPLQIAIPGNKSGVSTASTASRSSVITNSKPESTISSNPKIMSRKHMILSAFKHDEDLKNTVNIDQDEKVPIESAKFVSKRAEKDSIQCFPSSPKMPILSPQEKNRTTPLVSPAIGDPPNLEGIATSNCSVNASKPLHPEKAKSEINSLEEHLHKLISDAVKCSVHKDKESVYESVCRELKTPQGNKVFLTRQLSQNRNIPVANVAPIVQGKHITDSNIDSKTKDEKFDDGLDEEEEKMAEVITRSLLGRSLVPERINEKEKKDDKSFVLEKEDEHFMNNASNKDEECSNTSFQENNNENVFDEDLNSKRMSPGLKKLMLYRHRDVAETSKDLESCELDSRNDVCLTQYSEVKFPSVSDRQLEKERNVFGAFNEILAQKNVADDNECKPCWQGVNEEEEHEIRMVPNCDYDGDEEDNREHPKVRRSRQSNVRQQADRLIKKARHRRNSKGEGCLLGRGRLTRRPHHSHKGFVDFMPQVLTRRTRSRIPGKSPPRRKSRVGKHIHSPPRHKRRSSSQEIRESGNIVKTRQRRSSSLDRQTKSRQTKSRGKSVSYSDNELDHADNCVRVSSKAGSIVDCAWHNNDESTDEEYFQNYEDEFKQFIRNSDTNLKKTPSVKKKKGFHFKQKYIFQRKRKSKGRGKPLDIDSQPVAQSLDEIYSFHEEGQELLPYPCGANVIGTPSNIPVPPEVKRVTVNKDTGETLLHRAARMGQEEVALYCLATGTVDVNARDNARYTALHECAVRGRIKIAKHLLKHGADVNCCSVDGIRPIHDAVENDQMEVLRLLLSFGADPTLSTYAGRTLMKIARTERMRNYLQAYISDLNGYSSASEETSWQFKASSTLLEPEENYGCTIYSDLPSDPDDESRDMCTMSSKPLFSTRRLASEPGKRVEDFLLLDDILNSYHVIPADLASLGVSPHLIKNIPVQTLADSLSDSVSMESLAGKEAKGTVSAIRIVDSTQIIAKLEKQSHASGKRIKS